MGVATASTTGNIVANASLTYGAALAMHELNLSTGSGDRAISGIHRHFGITEAELPGVEGSFAEYTDLEPGIYEIGVWLESQERAAGSRDVLSAWNQKEVVAIADTTSIVGTDTGGLYEPAPYTTVEVEVPYGYLALALIDESSSTGTTIAHVTKLQRVRDLPYPVPIVYSNEPSAVFGSGGYNEPYGYANTGTGDRAASSLDDFMGFPDPVIEQGAQDDQGFLVPTEGSIVLYSGLIPGNYKIVWELVSSDSEPTRDGFFIWNGTELMVGGRRSLCTTQVTSTRFSSGRITSEIPVIGALAFIPVDTETTTGTTEVRIHRIERIGDLPGIMMYPAHIQILPDPMNLALTALNSYRHSQLNKPNQQQIPTPLPYVLESWQEYWQRGYNWYWHHLSPDGVDDSSLNQEKQNFEIDLALNNDGFKQRFTWAVGDIGLKTLAVFNYPITVASPVAGQTTYEEMWAFHLIRGLYRLASEIGLRNNIEQILLTNQIPEAHTLLEQYLIELGNFSSNSIGLMAGVFLKMREQNYLPQIFLENQNLEELYQLWIDSWGLD